MLFHLQVLAVVRRGYLESFDLRKWLISVPRGVETGLGPRVIHGCWSDMTTFVFFPKKIFLFVIYGSWCWRGFLLIYNVRWRLLHYIFIDYKFIQAKVLIFKCNGERQSSHEIELEILFVLNASFQEKLVLSFQLIVWTKASIQ